jgi:hypothetical protein
MNEYLFTSKMFKGQLFFGYEDGILIKFLNEAELNDNQLVFLQSNFPFVEDELQKILGKSGKIEIIIDVSFENFWEMYGKKVNKQRTEPLWYRLSEADRQHCLSKIQKYKNYCKMNNRTLKDPDTYIKNRSWQDELT